MTVKEVAAALSLAESRIRALANEGELQAERIGRALLFHPHDVAAFRARQRAAGRRLAVEGAWGLLAILSGDDPTWVPKTSQYRLRTRSADPEWIVRALETSKPRSRVFEWHLLPSDVRRLREDGPGVVTGVFVAFEHSLLAPSQRLEYDAYVDEPTARRLEQRFRPVHSSRLKRNAVLRVPAVEWILDRGAQAPLAVAAADLLDDPSERVRREGRDLLRDIAVDRRS